jgi:glycosyltransferase involved in cell wall biosynthesis
MMAPLISYVVSVFNKQPYLSATLDSIRAQADFAGHSIEIICADDCSTDGSLQWLAAEAARDPSLRVIANDANRGPAIRVNQAAAATSGEYILPVDADDLLPRNGSALFLKLAQANAAWLVFGKAQRGIECADVPEGCEVRVVDEPLTFCARKQLVHMGFLARADVWRAAGGADEGVFIQDQSLPLRLCAAASSLVYVDAVTYWLRPARQGNLSLNLAQQHHDRFLSVAHLLRRADIPTESRKALARQAVSALWKLRRDDGSPAPYLSAAFVRYLLNRALAVDPSTNTLRRLEAELMEVPNIRRASPVGAAPRDR